MVTPQAIDRLMALNAKVKDLMVVVDHPANVDALAAAAARRASRRRWSSTSIPASIAPAWRRARRRGRAGEQRQAWKSPKYAGVQFYCGRHQHIVDFRRKAEIEERTEYLKGTWPS